VLAGTFKLSEGERNQLLSSGQIVFRSRLSWASTYLKKAGLLQAPRRGWLRITEVGSRVLASNPDRVDTRFLQQFDSFVGFQKTRRADSRVPAVEPEDEKTPIEQLEDAFTRLEAELQDDLLQQVKSMSPRFFERLVVELLVRMGYGGNFRDAATAVGRSKDGGIDGIIKEDKLGLDTIYIQAKRWSNSVGRPEIQKFAGALQGRRARKGVFITTSYFTEDAASFALGIEKIVLIDGAELARLMVEYDLGVTRVASFDIKKIDSDYFTE
jgi:restriction system protein